ncbi:hypothetical protein BDZ89DRAFT_950364 [Hymenopellis radicata]|nr:hypothetical protein BDZ89DRAFT_950364 [Hymenopellis radicata]
MSSFHKLPIYALALLSATSSSYAGPSAAPDNIVDVTSVDKFCLIVPRTAHTSIGDSEHPGGMQTYCSPHGHTDPKQGYLPADFWREGQVAFKSATGKNGKRYTQLTGCINSNKLDRLVPSDAGGQYDSSGGSKGQGNPQGSVCLGYNHYVELVEPRGPRACIRCCDDPADCPTNKGTHCGCPRVIDGNYFNCG